MNFESNLIDFLKQISAYRQKRHGDSHVMRNLIICTFSKYHWDNLTKEDYMGRQRAPKREMRNMYKFLTGKRGRKRQLGRPKHRWNDIKKNLKRNRK
jgi:hypothetical protein